MKVLISGASIAGPAVAFWLARAGYEVTVVERATAVRAGGQAVDFKGSTHRTVLDRMGCWDDVERIRTTPTDQHVVDAAGRLRAVIPAEFIGGDLEVLRGDLGRLLYERTRDVADYRFGDRIVTLVDGADGVDVEFGGGGRGRYDLVVGADGIHSGVRRLVFGPEEEHVRYLGHYYAVAGTTTGVEAGRQPASASGRGIGFWFNEPGRLAAIGGPKAPDLFVFASGPLDFDRDDVERQKDLVRQVYADRPWRVPEMLDRLSAPGEFFLDGISRVRMPRYTRGRVALVGDSAYGNTLGGFGTGLAIVGAYVLAGELATAGGREHALERYDQLMHRYAKVARSGNAGPFLAPRNGIGIRLRNLMFTNRLAYRTLMGMTNTFATDIALPDYRFPPSPSARGRHPGELDQPGPHRIGQPRTGSVQRGQPGPDERGDPGLHGVDGP